MVKSITSFPNHSSPRSSLQNFPTELLFLTFQELDIPTLLKVCNACKRFQLVATEILSKKFKEPGVELKLTFEQEFKYVFNASFVLSNFNSKTGNFVFKPKQPMDSMRFVHSPMVKSPDLSKISISISNDDKSIVNNDDLTTMTTKTSNSSPSPNSSKKNNNNKTLRENFLEKHLPLNIKSNETQKELRYVYRVGHGTTHLKIPYIFTYSITDKPPPSMQNTRNGGERWLKPISLECAPSFFYPREPIAYKIFMKIRYFRKRNSNKKSSPPSSSLNKQKEKEKEKENIGFKEVDDFISVEMVNDMSYIKKSKNQNLQGHLQGNLTNKWKRGARS